MNKSRHIKKESMLQALEQSLGVVTVACKKADVPRSTFYKWLKEDEYFAEQVKICNEAGLITNTSLVIGYPEENSETLKETFTKLEALRVYPSAGFLLPLPETGMWKHAIENGHIKNIDEFLTAITERQDFSLNMTKMDEDQLKKEVMEHGKAIRVNLMLQVRLLIFL